MEYKDMSAMSPAELRAYYDELTAELEALDAREPENMLSEAYEEWGDLHEELEDLMEDLEELLQAE